MTIVGNFVVAAARGVQVSGGDPGVEQEVARNEVFAMDPVGAGFRRDNVTGPYEEAGTELVRALQRGALFGGAPTAETTRRACALLAKERQEGRSLALDIERHPVCRFLSSLTTVPTR